MPLIEVSQNCKGSAKASRLSSNLNPAGPPADCRLRSETQESRQDEVKVQPAAMVTTVTPAQIQTLRIRLLGKFSISAGSHIITEVGWRLRKACSLVKLLALAADHRLHREQIMAALWPDLEPEAAANNLYQALHAARRMLDPTGGTGPGSLQVQKEIVSLYPDRAMWVDVEAFEAAAARARRSRDPASYRAAIDLYTSDLLPQDRYEDWVSQRREELRQEYVSLLLDLASVDETAGDLSPAIETLQRAVRHEPSHEEAHRRLMWLYAISGNHHRARRQYQVLKETLRRELDAEPDPQSQRLYHDILEGRIPGIDAQTAAASAPAVLKAALDGAIAGLREPEPAVFRRLAVFAGSFNHDAVAAVCAEGIEKNRIPAILARLAEHSLIVPDPSGHEIRYRLLETVRQYAQARLDEAGETQDIRRHHCDWFVSVAERAEPELSGPDQALWVQRLEAEHENLRAALQFARDHDPAAGARLTAALWQFWEIRGYLAEGRQWSEEMLSGSGADLRPAPRARMLLGAGALAVRQGDRLGAQPMLEESLRLFQEVGDNWGVAWTLDNLGMLVLSDGDYARAGTMFERSLALFQRVGDRRGSACVFDNLGWTSLMQGDHVQARSRFEQALALFREIGDRRGTGRALANLANVLRIQGDLAAARTLLVESLQFCQVDTGERRSWLGSLRHTLRRSLLLRLQFVSWSGAVGSLALPCAGVCAGYPLIASLSAPGVIPLWVVVTHLFVLPVVVPLNVLMLVVSFRRHRRPWALIAGVLGGALTFAALAVHVVPGLHRALVPGLHRGLHDVIWPAMGLLLAAVVLDWRARRRLRLP